MAEVEEVPPAQQSSHPPAAPEARGRALASRPPTGSEAPEPGLVCHQGSEAEAQVPWCSPHWAQDNVADASDVCLYSSASSLTRTLSWPPRSECEVLEVEGEGEKAGLQAQAGRPAGNGGQVTEIFGSLAAWDSRLQLQLGLYP